MVFVLFHFLNKFQGRTEVWIIGGASDDGLNYLEARAQILATNTNISTEKYLDLKIQIFSLKLHKPLNLKISKMPENWSFIYAPVQN